MSDWAQHLPLSNRPRRDESAVTGDRSAATAAVLAALADVPDTRADVLAAMDRFIADPAGLGI